MVGAQVVGGETELGHVGLAQLTSPHPKNYQESRGEELEQLEPSPAPHSFLFNDIIESWNRSVSRTRVPAQPCPSPESGELRNSPLCCYLSSPLRGLGWRPCGTTLTTLCTRIFFLLSEHQLSFLNPSLFLLRFFHRQ